MVWFGQIWEQSGELNIVQEIQAQGRWSSSAFKAYMKKGSVKRLKFTEKLIKKLILE